MMEQSTGWEELTPQKRALLDMLLREGDVDRGGPDGPIPRRSVFSPVPQTYSQRRLWMLEALRPGTLVYTIRTAVRLNGGVVHQALRKALCELVRRHESLRTTFRLEGLMPVQVIAEHLEVDLPLVIRRPKDPPPETWLTQVCNAAAAQSFDLARGPLFRAVLFQVRPDDHLLLLTLHHIVADGWSLGIILRELSLLYAAFVRYEPSPLPELPIQYADFALWQQQRLSSPALRDQLDHWRSQLADLPVLVLPTDRPRPQSPSLAGERQHVILSREVTEALEDLSRQEGVTLYMTLLAAFQVVLSRWSGQEIFGIGTPIANRNRAETEGLIGFFLNTLVMRADLRGDPTFRDLLARVRETALTAYANQDVPFELLLESVRPSRDAVRTPVFQVFFNMLNFADDRVNRPISAADAPVSDDFAQFDLTLYAGIADGQLQLQLVHSCQLFERATAAHVLGFLCNLLTALVEHATLRVSALPIHAQASCMAPLLPSAPATVEGLHEAFPQEAMEQSLTKRFAEQARCFPNRAAVVAGATEWSYAELAGQVEKLALRLHGLVPEPAARVGVISDQDAPLVAAILAILRCGHAYVPLDPAHPDSRLAQIVDDAELVALVASRGHLDRARRIGQTLSLLALESCLEEDGLFGASLPEIEADANAYVLYTSGSTGRPKGVVQNHRNVMYHALTYAHGLAIGPNDRVAMVSSYGFDAAVMDIYGALLHGATLCLYDIRNHGLTGLRDWLDDEAITIYHSTPTVFRKVFEERPQDHARPTNRTLRAVVLGGEEVLSEDFFTFRATCPPGCVFVNGLGPTESTLALQYVIPPGHDVRYSRSVPVGYPVTGTQVLLRNEAGEDVGVFGVGRIILISRHLALGYWRRPEQTRAAFQAAALDPGTRQYLTGDLGRRLPDGAIEFVGRRDGQVKIRGQRVELGEVQAHLLTHPAVQAAVVSDTVHPARGPVLLAHVRLRSALNDPGAELRSHLRERLPEHMVPAAVIPVEDFPLTVNGKIDYSSLPSVDLTATPSRIPVAPTTELEQALASLFADVLGMELKQIGSTDDFFELGGHSLLATQLLVRIRAELQVDLPFRVIFQHPTVQALARLVLDSSQSTPRPVLTDLTLPWPVPNTNTSTQAGAND